MASQPGTGLAVFNPQAGAPAHIANFFEAEGTNIAPRQTVPSISPEGKTWTLSLNGEKTKLQRRNQDGDLEPLPIMKAVILDYAKQRGRAYYEGEYDPGNVSAPVCWSDDGVAPDASLPGPFPAGTAVEPGKSRKISAACATCPMAVKGSKVTPQGKAVTACGQHRMIALIPDPAMGLKDIPPLRLKIAMTSDWDKQSPDQEQQGWMAFSNYIDWLVARQVKHTAGLVTKMKFDPEAAYPKIFFSAERYLEPNELAIVAPLSKAPETTRLLGGTWTPAGVDGVPRDQQQLAQPKPSEDLPVQPAAAAPAAAAPAPAPEPAPAAAPAPIQYVMAAGETFTREQYLASGWTDEQLIANGKMSIAAAPAPAPEPTPAPAPAPAPAAAPTGIVVDEGNAAPAPAASTATTPAAAPSGASAGLVIDDAPSPALAAPAGTVVQEPAQAAAPTPAPAPQSPQPQAAAAAAATATAPVSTEVPADVASLLEEWG